MKKQLTTQYGMPHTTHCPLRNRTVLQEWLVYASILNVFLSKLLPLSLLLLLLKAKAFILLLISTSSACGPITSFIFLKNYSWSPRIFLVTSFPVQWTSSNPSYILVKWLMHNMNRSPMLKVTLVSAMILLHHGRSF